MIVVDIGNTNIVIGVYSNKKLALVLRLKTHDKKLLQKLYQHFKIKKINSLNLDYNNCIISSVSSFSTNEIIKFFKKLKQNINDVGCGGNPTETINFKNRIFNLQ